MNIGRLLVVAGVAVMPLVAHAGWEPTPWEDFVRACDQLPHELAVLEKQIAEGSNVVFTSQITIDLQRMEAGLRDAVATDKVSATVEQCEAHAVVARRLLLAAQEHAKAVAESQQKATRVEHQTSSEYKFAKAHGFADVDWLPGVGPLYQEIGATKLRRVMLLVDDGCGAHFRAVQQLGEFTIYAPAPSRQNLCSGDERVAVKLAPGVQAQRGSFIDRDAYYVFDRVATAKAADGFPTKIAVVRQVRK